MAVDTDKVEITPEVGPLKLKQYLRVEGEDFILSIPAISFIKSVHVQSNSNDGK
jgi:hypothetical protein